MSEFLETIDPQTLDDPIAQQTSWEPISISGNPTQLYSLVELESDRLAVLSEYQKKQFLETGNPFNL